MLVSAIQNQTTNSVPKLQTKKSNLVGLSKDLTSDSFSKENAQRVSFTSFYSSKTEGHALVGWAIGTIAAIAIVATAPISVPAMLAAGAVTSLGGAAIGFAHGAKKDEEDNKKP